MMHCTFMKNFSHLAKSRLSQRAVKLGCCSAMLFAIAMSPTHAADMQVSDLRLSVGILSNDFSGPSSATVSEGDDEVTTSSSSMGGRNSDRNYRLQFQYVRGNLSTGGGFIWGIGAAVNHATWDNGPVSAHATTPMVNLRLGYGYAFTPNWHFEITPFASYGQTFYSVSDDDSSSTQRERDHYVEYGASIGTFFALDGGFVFGLEVPYVVGRFDPDYSYTSEDGNSVSVSNRMRNRGFGVLATVGYRF